VVLIFKYGLVQPALTLIQYKALLHEEFLGYTAFHFIFFSVHFIV